MSAERCVIFISSCDKYSFMWRPFLALLRKYWPDCPYPIVLGAETKKCRVEGMDVRCPRYFKKGEKIPWSRLNRRMIEGIDAEYILMILEDHIIVKPVDGAAIARCLKLLDANENIGEFAFYPAIVEPGAPTSLKGYNAWSRRGVFRINAQAGVWRKDVLVRTFDKPESPWEWERNASARSVDWPEQFLFINDLKNSPLLYPRHGALFQGKWHANALDVLRQNGIRPDTLPRLEHARYHK